jgi:cytochrome o ubiquinol oxidase subunit 1
MTYWFPKVFGFRLHDRLGRWSAYLWQAGFLLAFMPLYALGLMGAVRRIDHYTDPSWQPFFIVSGIGVLVIMAGTAMFVLQLAYSVRKRKELRDTNGDPWDARTLEWSIPSPAPHYNFAVEPIVTERDDWWYKKQNGKTILDEDAVRDITLPKSSGAGFVIAASACLLGFGIIWHLWWLVVIMFIVMIVTVIRRTLDDNSEYIVTRSEIISHERQARA